MKLTILASLPSILIVWLTIIVTANAQCPALQIDHSFGCPETPDGESCDFICEEGYTLINSNDLEMQLYCNNTEWLGQVDALCQAVDCGMPEMPENGILDASNCPDTTFGSICNITCNEGYEAPDMASIECLSNGQWSSSTPSCQDADACENNPCDLSRSECTDKPAMDHVGSSEPGHICQCLDGFTGMPGHDGSGCYRVSIKTSGTTGMEFQVGDGHDYKFRIGSGREIVIGELNSQLEFLVSDNGPIETNRRSLESLMENEIANLETLTQSLSSEIIGNDNDIGIIQDDINDIQLSLEDHASSISDNTDNLEDLSTSISSSVNLLNHQRNTMSNEISSSLSTTKKDLDAAANARSTLSSRITTTNNLAKAISNEISTTEKELGSFKVEISNDLSTAVKKEELRAKAKENSLTTSIGNVNTALTQEVARAKQVEATFMASSEIIKRIACISDKAYYFDGTSCKLKIPVIGGMFEMSTSVTMSSKQGSYRKITAWRTSCGGCFRKGITLSNGDFIVSKQGLYGFQAQIRFDGACSGYFRLIIAKENAVSYENGLASIRGHQSCNYETMRVGGFLRLNANMKVSLQIFSSSDSSFVLQSESGFSMAYIGEIDTPGFQADLGSDRPASRTTIAVQGYRTTGFNTLFDNQNVLNEGNGRAYAKEDSIWLVHTNMRLSGAGDSYFRSNIDVNGRIDDHNGMMAIDGNPSPSYETLVVSGIAQLTKGDYLRVTAEGNGDSSWRVQTQTGFGGVQLPDIGRVSFAAEKNGNQGCGRGFCRIRNWRTSLWYSRNSGLHEDGNIFDKSNGYFVAPRDGVYFTFANVRISSGCGSYFRLIISVDESTDPNRGLHAINGGITCDYHTLTVAGYVYLRQRQTLSILLYSDSDTSYTADSQSGFGATLISRET